MVMLFAVGNSDAFVREIDVLKLAVEEVNLLQQFSHGTHDVGDVEIAGRDFMEHRREQEEVFFVHECDFGVETALKSFIQFQRAIHAAEPAAQNQDAWFHSNLPPRSRDKASS